MVLKNVKILFVNFFFFINDFDYLIVYFEMVLLNQILSLKLMNDDDEVLIFKNDKIM